MARITLILFIGSCFIFIFVLPSCVRQFNHHIRTAEHIAEFSRISIAAYAADNPNHSFPAQIANREALQTLAKSNMRNLDQLLLLDHLLSMYDYPELVQYTPIDADNNGSYEDYRMIFFVPDMSDEEAYMPGARILVSSSGIEKEILRNGGPFTYLLRRWGFLH